jgi:hypothetical protein
MNAKGGVSPSTVGELEELLGTLESERHIIRKRIEDQLEELERRIAAVQLTLGLLAVTENRPVVHVTSIRPSSNGWVNRLEGLTHYEALVKLAEDSHKRTVRPTDAAPILQKAGLAKGTSRNLVPHLYRMLRESSQFEKVAPGTFRLTLGQPATKGGEVTAS